MTPIWLKNITVFNLKLPKLSTEELVEALATHTFTPCGQLDREQHGFTNVFGQDSLVRKTGDVYWVEVMSEQKVVPGAVVKRLLAEKVQEIEAKEARKVGKKEKKELKENLIDELLATALANRSSTLVMIDPVQGYVLVNSTSNKKTDLIFGLLNHSIDGIGLERLSFDNSVAKQMANLLVSDNEDFIFSADSNLLLKGPGSPASTVRFGKHKLQEPEVIAHLKAGLRPAAMELLYNDRVSFVLTDPFAIKQVKFTDQVQEDLPETTAHADELIDATLLLQVGELRELLKDLREWLGEGEGEDSQEA